MKFVDCAALGRPVSRLAIGSLRFQPGNADHHTERMDRFAELGGNLVDTAEAYGNGRSERAVGEYLAARSNRADWVVLTKGAVEPRLVRPEYIRLALQRSLDRLCLDRVDIYLLHRDDPSVPVGELVDVLEQARQAGWVASYGASNWTVARLVQARQYAEQRGIRGMAFSSPHVGLAQPMQPFWPHCTHANHEDLGWYRRSELAVLGWSAVCRGFFASDTAPESRAREDLVRVYYNTENFERLRRARWLAERRGVLASQIALAYVLSLPANVIALVGPRDSSELELHEQALGIELGSAELEWLDLRSNAPPAY